MKNVGAYIRVSTDGQCGEDKYGLEVQKQMIAEYCEANDMTIIKWFSDEGESGAKERPGFDEIVYGELTEPPIEAVIVAKSDRVARDINIYFFYKMMLKKRNIQLISITEDFGHFGVFSPMLEAFTLCVAEMERENIMKRTSSGRKAKAKRGGFVGGRIPFGYSNAGGKLVINPEEARWVREMFMMKLTGVTYKGIVERLTENDVITRTGVEWSIPSIQTILKNEKFYRGYYRYGKENDWVVGQHEPILTEEFYQELNGIIEKNEEKLKQMDEEINRLKQERARITASLEVK